MKIMTYLSEKIGPRVAGTQGEYMASQYLKKEFETLGLETHVQQFSFLDWVPKEMPRLQILEPQQFEISAAPMAYTLSTPPNGVIGRIRKIGKMYIIPGYMEWSKYCIEDGGGRELGFFIANPKGPKIPVPNTSYMLPGASAVIGKEDAEKLDTWAEEGKEIRGCLYTAGHFEPSCSQNVIGILGKGIPQTVVCAHYDTVYDSCGAVDNASGVQVLYDIADRLLSEGRQEKESMAFIAMGCEEPGFWGSRYYVKYLRERGLLGAIRICINFDMVGRGDAFFLRCGNGVDGEQLITTLSKGSEGAIHQIKADTAKASSDNWSFHEQEIPNVQLVALPFPLYHQSKDVLDNVDTKMLKGATEIGYQLVRGLSRNDS